MSVPERFTEARWLSLSVPREAHFDFRIFNIRPLAVPGAIGQPGP